MIVLNVLPPSLKEELELRRMKSAVFSVLIVTVFFFAFSMFTVFTNLWISGILSDLTLESDQALQTNADILKFNKMVSRVEGLQSTYAQFAPSFLPIFNSIPEGVKIKEIEFNGIIAEISIIAETEEKDLIFATKDNIQELGHLSEVRLQTDELITKTRKTFTVTATISPERL